jgi:hypothetical protein
MSDTPQREPRGITTGGLPYPEDTDALMAGAQAIKALAQAIDARPWVHMVRWTQGNLGTGADAPLNTWDFQESNFPIGETPAQGGFITPVSGLYMLTLSVEFFAAWTGNPLLSAGFKSSAVPPREIFLQRIEAVASTNRRVYNVAGILRLAAGERCSAFMNQPGGFGTVNHSSGAAPHDRHSSRFAGEWIAP